MKLTHLLAAVLLSTTAYACYENPYTPGTSRDDLSEGDDDDDDHGDKKKGSKADDDEETSDSDAPSAEGELPTPSAPATETEPKAETPPPPAANAFTNASPYVALTPDDQTSRHHGGSTNAGKDCMSCHGAGGGAPRFAIGGTVLAGKTGVPQAQVRVVDPSGNEIALIGTDNAGNFWLKGTRTIPAGSRVAIRKGETVRAMNATIGTGGCNQSGCHNANNPITL